MPIFKNTPKFDRGINLFGSSKGEYIAKNWHSSQVTANLGDAALYQQSAQAWFSFGVNGTLTAYAVSSDGSDWHSIGTILNFQVACALQDSHVAGPRYLIIGGGLSTNTLYKIKRSSNLGGTWEDIQVTGSSDAMICGALAYTASGYFARLNDDIFWSPTCDTSSWNLVLTLPDPSSRNNLCTNGTLLIAYCNTNNLYYTTTGSASWTTQGFPNSFVVTGGMTYAKDALGHNIFVATGADATGPAAYYSFTGTSWSLLYRFATGTSFGSLTSLNEVLVGRIILPGYSTGVNVCYSPDGGLTWYPATTYPSASSASILSATRSDESPHQVGIFLNGMTKMSIVG
jgi:hypothetical protein